MVDSICFTINSKATKQCPTTFPNPQSPPKLIEEWTNPVYHEIPDTPDFYKVIITCEDYIQSENCLDQPEKITQIHAFAGVDCLSNLFLSCNLGKLNVKCLSDPSMCGFIELRDKGIFQIHPDPQTQPGFGIKKIWTAFSFFPTWILDRVTQKSSILFPPQFSPPDIKFASIGISDTYDIDLTKITKCDALGVCK